MLRLGKMPGAYGLVVVTAALALGAATAQADVAPPDGLGQAGTLTFDTFSVGGDDGAVNLNTGNLNLTTGDLTIADTSNGDQLGRAYNSLLATARDAGEGWTFDTGYDIRLVVGGSEAVLATRTGFAEHFTQGASGDWVAADNGYTMIATGTGYTVSDGATGRTYNFDGSGQLASEGLPGGQALTFDYTSAAGQTRLSSINDPGATHTRFSYNGNGSAIEADTPDSHHFYWTYDGQNRLTTFEDDQSLTTTYSYDGTSSRLTGVDYPDGATLTVAYDATGRATDVTTTPAGGSATSTLYAYGVAGASCAAGSASQTTVTYPSGGSNTICFDAAGNITYSDVAGDDTPEIDDTTPDPVDFAPDFGDGDDGTCYVDDDPVDDYCGADDSTEPSDETPIADEAGGLSALVATLNTHWGISDNNPFNASDNLFGDQLALSSANYGLARKTIPFNIEAVGGNDLADAHAWVAAALAEHKHPLLSIERCRNADNCDDASTLPTSSATGGYYTAFKAILDDPGFAGVNDFTAWNEPNHRGYQPTASVPYGTGADANDPNGARIAGRYWHIANELCSKREDAEGHADKCNVAAGDFLDSDMTNPNSHDASYGKAYLNQYRIGMVNAPQAWAWHPYSDTQQAVPADQNPSQRWPRYRGFLRATGGSNRSVWITEVGVYNVLFKANETNPTIKNTSAQRQRIMSRLLAELPSIAYGDQGHRLKRFYYYEWRGDTIHEKNTSQLDTGLANGDDTPRAVFSMFRSRVNG